jgi:prepilin-type N-terminal cleavage/methylation domain-containing protein
MVKRSGFTLIELVMVVVVLGIVASLGAEILSTVYQNYLRSRSLGRLQSQTDLALEAIAKRLQYRVKSSLIARKENGEYLAFSDHNINKTYSILEWIGISNESFLGSPQPGWSGLVDLHHPATNKAASTLKTPHSHLSYAGTILYAISHESIHLDASVTSAQPPALVFKKPANVEAYGWGTTTNTKGGNTHHVVQHEDTVLRITSSPLPDEIFEHYILSHSAYALVPQENPNDALGFTLLLHYNYQPWHAMFYTEGKSAILAEHVSAFLFKDQGETVHLKLCLHDNNQTGAGDYLVACREKIIL